MKLKEMELALLSMGYRTIDPECRQWAKPVGYSLLTFDTIARRWSQRIRLADKTRSLVQTSAEWPEKEDLVSFLAYQETYHMVSGSEAGSVPWNFTTSLQIAV